MRLRECVCVGAVWVFCVCGALALEIWPPPAGTLKRGKVLHLFSGPSSRRDSLARFMSGWGFEVIDFDCKANEDTNQDLVAQPNH